MNKIILLFTFCIMNIFVFAQSQPINSAPVDFMRSEGKLYVVMAVVVTILLGLFIYLVSLDKKIKKLEKKN